VILALFLLGLALLVLGADLLVRGAARVAGSMGVAPLVVGLTVVAFGTSTPELAVTLSATLRGEADLGLGNVVGSNIMNVLLILGLSAVAAPLLVKRRLIRLEVPLLIGISALVLALALDGTIGRLEGAGLVAAGLAYTGFLLHQARSDHTAHLARNPPPVRPRRIVRDVIFILAGLGLLVLGSRWLVDAATALAEAAGVTRLAIGLTVVAIGTSLPELATSVLASLRGQRDIAVGNIIGSNLFNLLIVLGGAATLSPGGVAVAPAAVAFDLPIMVAVTVACLPIFFTGHVISRGEGILFLAYFGAYTTYVLMGAAGHDALPLLRHALLFFALPLTALVLALFVARELRRG
jgi:cation:H+ antiporter